MAAHALEVSTVVWIFGTARSRHTCECQNVAVWARRVAESKKKWWNGSEKTTNQFLSLVALSHYAHRQNVFIISSEIHLLLTLSSHFTGLLLYALHYRPHAVRRYKRDSIKSLH